MSDIDERRQNYATAAAKDIPRLTEDLAATLGVADDESTKESIGEALARAFMYGIEAGESEVLAVAAEQGVQIPIERRRLPDD